MGNIAGPRNVASHRPFGPIAEDQGKANVHVSDRLGQHEWHRNEMLARTIGNCSSHGRTGLLTSVLSLRDNGNGSLSRHLRKVVRCGDVPRRENLSDARISEKRLEPVAVNTFGLSEVLPEGEKLDIVAGEHWHVSGDDRKTVAVLIRAV